MDELGFVPRLSWMDLRNHGIILLAHRSLARLVLLQCTRYLWVIAIVDTMRSTEYGVQYMISANRDSSVEMLINVQHIAIYNIHYTLFDNPCL